MSVLCSFLCRFYIMDQARPDRPAHCVVYCVVKRDWHYVWFNKLNEKFSQNQRVLLLTRPHTECTQHTQNNTNQTWYSNRTMAFTGDNKMIHTLCSWSSFHHKWHECINEWSMFYHILFKRRRNQHIYKWVHHLLWTMIDVFGSAFWSLRWNFYLHFRFRIAHLFTSFNHAHFSKIKKRKKSTPKWENRVVREFLFRWNIFGLSRKLKLNIRDGIN